MNRETCQTCKWWDAINSDRGVCHFNPPQLIRDQNQVMCVFPQTDANAFCGRYKPHSIVTIYPRPAP